MFFCDWVGIFSVGDQKTCSSGDSGCWSCSPVAFCLCCLLSWCKSTEFSEETLGKLNKTFLWFARLTISFAICWIVNTGRFMVCIAICHSRKRYFPVALKLQRCPPCLYPKPALALPRLHSKYCWVGSAPTMPVWRKGDALVSLTHSFSGSLETASGAGVTSRAGNWAKGSLTQILCAKAELTGSSLDICHVHLPLAAPFPRTAGEPGVLKWERGFFGKGCTTKVLMLFSAQDRQASLEIGCSSAKYLYFPISSPLNSKTQPTKWATRHLSRVQILPPKMNLYILTGMAVSFPPSIYLIAFWLLTHWRPILKSVNFFLPVAFESTPRMVQSQRKKVELHSLFEWM